MAITRWPYDLCGSSGPFGRERIDELLAFFNVA